MGHMEREKIHYRFSAGTFFKKSRNEKEALTEGIQGKNKQKDKKKFSKSGGRLTAWIAIERCQCLVLRSVRWDFPQNGQKPLSGQFQLSKVEHNQVHQQKIGLKIY